MDGEGDSRMFRERVLTYRICLGILKTDQWKPNSKMNQGTSLLNCHSLFHAFPQERGERRDQKRGVAQWKTDIQ
jgi:hypothetical protein